MSDKIKILPLIVSDNLKKSFKKLESAEMEIINKLCLPNSNKLTEFVKLKRSQRYTLKAILTMLDITDRQYRWAMRQADAQLKNGLVSKIEELTK